MDFTIEKLCKDILPDNNRTVILDNNILLSELDENDTPPSSIGSSPFSFVIRTDFVAALLCRQGSMKLKIDLTEYHLKKNQLLIIIPGATCEQVEATDDCSVTIIAFNNLQELKEPNARIALIPRRFIYKSLLLKLTETEIKDILLIYDAMRDRIIRPDYSFKREAVYSLLQVLYIDMCCLMKQSMEEIGNEVRDRNKQIFDSFIEELTQNSGKNREIAFYANKLCITPKYLSRIVKTASGRFAKEWIRDYTILQAKSLLDSGQYTIQQVSDKLNFPNQSFFGTYFKNAVGCSPKIYMEK